MFNGVLKFLSCGTVDTQIHKFAVSQGWKGRSYCEESMKEGREKGLEKSRKGKNNEAERLWEQQAKLGGTGRGREGGRWRCCGGRKVL